MLGKLLKYEFRSGASVFIFGLMMSAALYILALLAEALNLAALMSMFLIGLVILGVGALIYSFVLIATRYYKSMFGNEAYLIQTLPVKKSGLLLSKYILAVVYMLAGTVVLLFSLYGISSIAGWVDDFRELMDFLSGEMSYTVVYFIVSTVLQAILAVCSIYFAITLANTKPFIKHNVGFSFLFYFSLNFIIGIIDTVATLYIPLSLEDAPSGFALVFEAPKYFEQTAFISKIGLGSAVTDFFIIIILIFLTEWLLRKKTSVR